MPKQKQKSMTNTKDKELIKDLTELVAKLIEAAQQDKSRARKYVKARTAIEKAMRFIGEGIQRTERPQSVGLPVHQRVENPAPRWEPEPKGDILADNLEDKPKRKRNAKGADPGFGDAL